MSDRSELVEAALEVYPEGLALMDPEGRVMFWNRAAETMTGFTGADVVGRPIPEALEPLTLSRDCDVNFETGRRMQVHAQHKSGYDVPAIAHRVILRDELGKRIGTAAVFHSCEQSSALPHGETSEGPEVRQSQAEMQDRLETEYESFLHQDIEFGVMWIAVDQAHELRKTHGVRACETMLEAIERRLANGLRPGEEVGRWGNNEFLVLSHERSANALASHTQALAGLARTAEFRWWGDRVSLTVSVGAAMANRSEALPDLLERAQGAMLASERSGGNHITLAPGRQP